MRVIESLADAFIATFGITQPDAAARRRASWFILGLLVLMLAAVSVAGPVIYRVMHT
jgi:hypothetical protein